MHRLIYFAAWCVISVDVFNPLASNGQAFLATAPGSFSFLSIALMFGVMIYFTVSKHKTHFGQDSTFEVVRMLRRLPPTSHSEFLSKKRSGPVFLSDIENSSDQDDAEKLATMSELARKFVGLQRKERFFLEYGKSLGDAFLLLVRRRGSTDKDDFLELIRHTKVHALAYRKLVQDRLPSAGLHLSIYAISNYIFYIRPDKSLGGAAKTLDEDLIEFSSRELNYLMKHSDKSPLAGTILIAGSRDFFTAKVIGELLHEPIALADLLENAGDPDSAESARKLKLVVGFARPDGVEADTSEEFSQALGSIPAA